MAEALYPEIVANDAQRAEWVKLYRIDRTAPAHTEPAYSEPLSTEFLESNPYLMLDSRFFARNNDLARTVIVCRGYKPVSYTPAK